jgi:hypothetical protein
VARSVFVDYVVNSFVTQACLEFCCLVETCKISNKIMA